MKNAEDFNLVITCRHADFGDGFKGSIKKQLLKLTKFHKNIIDANVILDKQNSNYKVEILLRVPGSIISATNVDFNYIKAFDLAVDKVKVQIKKHRSKVVDHRKTTPLSVLETQESEEFDDIE